MDEKEDGNELSGLPTDSVLRKEANAHITSSRQRATSQPNLLTAQHSLDTSLQLSGSRMGGPLGARQRTELATPRNAPSSTCQREPKGTVDGRPVDAYPHKAFDNRDGLPKYHSEATELARAYKVGPLTREALETERKASEFDPQQPRRPLRRLPVGAEEKDSEDAKKFRRFALENNILIQMVDNPKRRGKDSWKRYNLYQNASTLREIIELSVTSRDAAARAMQIRKAREDIKYDFLHGYILFPQYETNSPSHFVNAGEIALMANVMNIHQLYSEEEMDQARQVAEAEKASEATRMIKEKCKQIKLQEACAFVSFNTQIASMWDVDLNLQNYNFLYLQETSVGATLVSSLITDATEPSSFKHIGSCPDKDEWYDSVKTERTTLESRRTWKLIKRKSIGNTKTIKCKYVFKVKKTKSNETQRKSRLVAQGFTQVAGVDYHLDQTYAGVVSYSSMRFLLSQAVGKGMILTQTDISAAYLESFLEEDIYIWKHRPTCGTTANRPWTRMATSSSASWSVEFMA